MALAKTLASTFAVVLTLDLTLTLPLAVMTVSPLIEVSASPLAYPPAPANLICLPIAFDNANSATLPNILIASTELSTWASAEMVTLPLLVIVELLTVT